MEDEPRPNLDSALQKDVRDLFERCLNEYGEQTYRAATEVLNKLDAIDERISHWERRIQEMGERFVEAITGAHASFARRIGDTFNDAGGAFQKQLTTELGEIVDRLVNDPFIGYRLTREPTEFKYTHPATFIAPQGTTIVACKNCSRLWILPATQATVDVVNLGIEGCGFCTEVKKAPKSLPEGSA